jgi:hypothetical protein
MTSPELKTFLKELSFMVSTAPQNRIQVEGELRLQGEGMELEREAAKR